MTGRISLRIQEVKKVLDPKKMADGAYKEFKINTPVRTGNARRNTSLIALSKDYFIQADYPYAQRLDEGYSKQRPAGMSKPTIDWIRSYISKKLGTGI